MKQNLPNLVLFYGMISARLATLMFFSTVPQLQNVV